MRDAEAREEEGVVPLELRALRLLALIQQRSRLEGVAPAEVQAVCLLVLILPHLPQDVAEQGREPVVVVVARRRLRVRPFLRSVRKGAETF